MALNPTASGAFAAAVACAILFVAEARAQEPASPAEVSPSDWFNRIVDETVAVWQKDAKWVHDVDVEFARARRRHRFNNVPLTTPGLTRANAASAIELAAAAIRTSLDGVEAGVSVAPVALFGAAESPHQPTLTLAALENDKSRYALGYNYQTPWDPRTPADLGLPRCMLSKAKEKKLREAASAIRGSYEETCAAVYEWLASPVRRHPAPESLDDVAEQEARNACRPEARKPEFVTLQVAVERLKTFFVDERKRILADYPDGWPEFRKIVAPYEFALHEISTFKEPPLDCYEPDEIKSALANASWTQVRYRWGAALTLDTFALVFGFNPTSEPLAKGQPARLDFARLAGAFEYHLGIGGGRSREAPSDPLAYYVAPTLSIAVVTASLSGEPLYKDGKLNSVDGKPPPRLVFGLEGELQYTFDPPTAQATHFSAVKITPFADFLFTESLGFRLAIPIRGKLVTRKADASVTPPVTELQDLQWSIPVSFVTVVKM